MKPTPHAFGVDDIACPSLALRQIVFLVRVTLIERKWVIIGERRSSSSRSGSPRQLDEMKENKRCSTLFHLLVPGGKWQTASVSPVWSARRCNSHFHSRRRQPLLPPPSAVISNRSARR